MNLHDSGLSAKDVESVRQTLRLFPKISEAILYGSRAKGSYRPGSDINLTLKGNELSYKTCSTSSWHWMTCFCPTKSIYRCIASSTIRS